MAYIDLLLNLDDDLHEDLSKQAVEIGWPVEEVIRKALLHGIGRPYRAPGPDADCVMRPMVELDLRTA